MRALLAGQSIAVGYKDQDFHHIVRQLQQEPVASVPTLISFIGMAKLQMEAAAKELAATLGKSLYRVDLHAVVSRYIGETEKNLSMVFERAARTDTILLFDEGDALFGKQTTNQEAGAILAKTGPFIEDLLARHRGIVLAFCKSNFAAERRRHRIRHLIIKYPPS